MIFVTYYIIDIIFFLYIIIMSTFILKLHSTIVYDFNKDYDDILMLTNDCFYHMLRC